MGCGLREGLLHQLLSQAGLGSWQQRWGQMKCSRGYQQARSNCYLGLRSSVFSVGLPLGLIVGLGTW